MKKITLAFWAIASLTDASSAFASDNGWYLFGAVGKTTGSAINQLLDYQLKVDGKNGFSSSLSTPIVYNLFIGYQINKFLALEGGYLGSTHAVYSASGGNLAGPITASVRINGGSVAAVGVLPLANQISLLGKVGVAYVQVMDDGKSRGITNDITCGIGARYDYSDAVSMRFNLDSYNIGSSYFSPSRSNVWTIGVGRKF